MQKIYTLIISLTLGCLAHAQVILNEVYCSPGAGSHEFFELYNSSSSPTPAAMDGYTIVTYFDDGTNEGFYVMDLPNLFVTPRGYFVGSAAIPFNYQGVNGSTSSDFSWNDLAFMSANNGYLKKWILGTSDLTDGNASYDEAPVPADFNDVFDRKSGNGASYSFFVYQNGILLNSFFGGGSGGGVPEFIPTLPELHIDMSATATDFDIDFSAYTTVTTEQVIQDAGSDNGYMRTRDGFCGAWTKSSANVFHTPKASNGAQTGITGEISVSRAIIKGTALTGSIINYDVVGAPDYAFPIVLQVYLDDGTVAGQLDADDTFVESNTEYTLNDGGFVTKFSPHNYDVMIVVNSAFGCIDKILYTPNLGVLPVQLISFEGKEQSNKALLNWVVTENESGKSFIVEKSADGKVFTPVNEIKAVAKSGTTEYSFTDAALLKTITHYRLKIIDKNNIVSYSRTVVLNLANAVVNKLKILQNPVISHAAFIYTANEETTANVNIYNATGVMVWGGTIKVQKGENRITSEATLLSGMYVLEINCNNHKHTTKFIKQ